MSNKCSVCGGEMESTQLSKMFNTSGEFGSRMISVTDIPGEECVECHREVMSADTEIRVEEFVKRIGSESGDFVKFPG